MSDNEYAESHDEFFEEYVETSENGSHTVIGKDRYGWLSIRQEGRTIGISPPTVDDELTELLEEEF